MTADKNASGEPNAADLLPVQLDRNLARVRERFAACSDLVILDWRYGPKLAYRAASVFFNTLFVNTKLNYMKQTMQDILPHLVGPGVDVQPGQLFAFFEANGVSEQSATLLDRWSAAEQQLLQGSLLIFFDGWNKTISYRTAELETRQVEEPESEPVVQGPREGTVENLQKNLGMIRLRIKSASLKFETRLSGAETNSTIVYGYIDGVVNRQALTEFKTRLERAIPGNLLETSYIEGLIEDSPYSPFPQFRYTERTDVAAAALLNGKIIVLMQGTGSILLCPGLFFELLQTSEDYYQRTLIANFIRFLRMIALLIAITLPSLYIAITTFHTELMPTVLLLAIIDSREGIPFGAFFEATIMVFFFELLKEAGIRLPRPVGSAVSIVGALVIGESAINAGIASPIMVVVVALTGIASFALPQYNLAIALRLLQFPLMGLSAILGGFGILIGFLFIWLHLVTLTSLGVPYMTPLAPFRPRQFRDTLIRTRIAKLIRRTKPPESAT